MDIQSEPVVGKILKEENEADTFANNHLIPNDAWRLFYGESKKYTDTDILKFSKAIKVHPAIIRGRICHLRNEFAGRTRISYTIS